MQSDEYWMQQALDLAKQAQKQGEVPVGAVVVKDDCVVGRGYNQPISLNDPTAHAEIVALRDAANNLNNYRLLNTTLYVTLEPCVMCVGAILHARVLRVVFGASDPKAGALISVFRIADELRLNHRLSYQGNVYSKPCSSILKDFFRSRR